MTNPRLFKSPRDAYRVDVRRRQPAKSSYVDRSVWPFGFHARLVGRNYVLSFTRHNLIITHRSQLTTAQKNYTTSHYLTNYIPDFTLTYLVYYEPDHDSTKPEYTLWRF